ncbi:MAG: hypothetical protein ABEK50_14690, partial [bacterium]
MKLSRFLQVRQWAQSFTGDGLPDGPGGFPYVGLDTIARWQENPVTAFTEFHQEYGNAFTIRFMGLKAVVLIGAEANQRILDRVEEVADIAGSVNDQADTVAEATGRQTRS